MNYRAMEIIKLTKDEYELGMLMVDDTELFRKLSQAFMRAFYERYITLPHGKYRVVARLEQLQEGDNE